MICWKTVKMRNNTAWGRTVIVLMCDWKEFKYNITKQIIAADANRKKKRICKISCECCVYTNYRKVIWNICPKLTCCVLLLYPCSISPNSVSLKRTSCLGHFGPSQFSDCRRHERLSPASLYSCTHLRTRHKLSIRCKVCTQGEMSFLAQTI